ncbi:MAG: hypothetical protein B6240_12365 [Desulfobacteraceae bacterium 4572_87]|nr:MAG: hypothetical protein B6240_12365 [Desulfobacteraceae bacterium 4572_87]
MKIGPDCVPCILKMCLGFIRKTELGDSEAFELFNDVMKIPSLKGEDWTVTSPDVIEKVMRISYEMLGDENPSHLQSTIRDKMKYPLPEEQYQQMKGQLANTRRLVYFGDNAGEIVLDKLLISTLKELYDLDVTFVVRSMPTLNDVTLTDALDIKMNKVARVLENGIDGPFPGTRMFRCSPEIQDIFRQADLVISKGGGNFDSLDEDKKRYGQKISFLFLSKCYLYEKLLHTPLEAPILSNYYD